MELGEVKKIYYGEKKVWPTGDTKVFRYTTTNGETASGLSITACTATGEVTEPVTKDSTGWTYAEDITLIKGLTISHSTNVSVVQGFEGKVDFFGRVFISDSRLTSIDLSNIRQNGNGYNLILSGCTNLAEIKGLNDFVQGAPLAIDYSFDVINYPTVRIYFDNCTSLTALDLSGLNTSLTGSAFRLFSGCSSLRSVTGINKWDVGNMTRMDSAFKKTALVELDLTGWDTSQVTNMGSMFSGCNALTTLNLSGWNTSQVTNMGYMFSSCSALTSLDLSGWDLSKVTSMGSMFAKCAALTTLNLSGWNTSQVTNMKWMFYDCNALTTLNLSGWDTSQVTDMGNMFSGCNALTTLNLSGWNTSQVTNMDNMFDLCLALTTIKAIGCNDDTITKLTSALTDAGLTSQVTIVTS